MTIRFTDELLRRVFNLEVLPFTLEHVPFGVEINSEAVKGGELFIADSAVEAELAVGRGAALAIYDTEEPVTSSSLCMRVASARQVLRAIAEYVRETHQRYLCVIVGDEGANLTKELAAKLFLRQGRGLARLTRTLDEGAELASFCNGLPDHQWALVALQPNEEIEKLLGILQPDLLVKLGSADVPELMRAVPKATVVSSTALACSAGSHSLGFQDLSSSGFGRLSGTLIRDRESVPFSTNIMGDLNAAAVLAAIGAVSVYVPSLALSEIANNLRQFQPAVSRPLLHTLGDGRRVVDCIEHFSCAGLKALTRLCQIENEKDGKLALIIAEPSGLTDVELADWGVRLAELSPLCIAYVGKRSDIILAACREAQMAVFVCESGESAAHTLGKLAFSLLVVVGAFNRGLDRVIETLIYSFGETLEVPVNLGESFDSEE